MVRLGEKEISYERLILSTGSTPQTPPVPGTKLARQFLFKTFREMPMVSAGFLLKRL